MKKMKKVLALGLAAVLTLGMSMTAWAAPSSGDDEKIGTGDDRGSITVEGIDEEETSSVVAAAYPIIQAHYSDKGVFDGYKKLYMDLDDDGWGSIETSGTEDLITGKTGGGEFDAETVNKVFDTAAERTTVDALAKRIFGDGALEGVLSDGGAVTDAGISLNRTVTNGKITGFTSNDVLVGTYLVIIKNSDVKNYNPVIVSSYYTNGDRTENQFEGGILNIAEGKAWVKVTDKPSVGDKEVTEVKRPGEGGETLKNGAGENVTGSANIGDVLTYQITINSIPYYGGKNPVFKLTDTLTEGLKYAGNDVKVTVDGGTVLERGTDYVIKNADDADLPDITDKTEMVIDFVVGNELNKEYTLNAYQGKSMVIEYKATVQEAGAGFNQDPNTNKASLEYSKNSHIEGEEGKGEDPGKITRTYTFDISGAVNGNGKPMLEKVDSTTGEPLKEAEFKLYTDKDCTAEYTNPAMANPIISGDDGTFTIKGLAEGTYWLKEEKAPDGYSLNEHAFKIEITATYEEKTEKIDGKDFTVNSLTQWAVKIDDDDVDTFNVENSWVGIGDADTYPINNTKLINLPSTGGIGTTIFTVAGVLLMVGAAFLFFVNRRKAQGGQKN